jgi:hypothetical protein
VQAILSASWMQKKLIAHKFNTGWEVWTMTKRNPKSKKGGEDDGEMEWWVKYKSETGSGSLDYSHALPKDR